MTSGEEVVWNGHVVGWVESLSCDNLNVFGRWNPRHGSETHEFLTRLRAGHELVIQVGPDGHWAFLDTEPFDEIEFKSLNE